ncbi:hypothetical protein DY000_02059628 [Brassica cretica]|uniref:Uncharacterized protein n=1 Tax=Brassica cretica TaxID=69181 RepID=A0ABQ7B372_BRACR|nr:hypothetical protein DY000_02059628 [Brassica cretica]
MKKKCDLLQAEPSPELITTTAHRDVDKLNLTHAKPPSCSSRRDEAIATDHAAIGVPMKQHSPRARAGHAPPPEIVFAAFAAGPPSRRR